MDLAVFCGTERRGDFSAELQGDGVSYVKKCIDFVSTVLVNIYTNKKTVHTL